MADFTVNIEGFNQAMRQLSKITKEKPEKVIQSEMAEVMALAGKKTKKASKQKIRKAQRKAKQYANVTADIGDGQQSYSMRGDYSQSAKNKLYQGINAIFKDKLKRVGLASAIWYVAGLVGRFRVRPSKEAAAIPQKYIKYLRQFVRVKMKKSFGSIVMEVISSYPKQFFAKAHIAARGALKQRNRRVQKAINNWANMSMKRLTNAFPGINITKNG